MKRAALILIALAGACGEASAVETARARRGDLVLGVEVEGSLEAVDSTPMRPPGLPGVWDYKIAFLVPEGSEVAPGDRLVGYDTSELMRQLENVVADRESVSTEIRRQLAAAKLAREYETLGFAEREAEVKKLELLAAQPADLVALIERKRIGIDRDLAVLSADHERSRAELAKRSDQAALEGLRDKLAYAEKRKAQIEENVARMVVVASRAGTVIHPTGWNGDKLKVGDSAWRMQTVVEIVSLDKMRGAGQVDEVDSARVTSGRPFAIRVDAHPDTELVGVVGEVSDGFTSKSRADPSKVSRIKLDIADAKGLPLRPGMRFRGEVEVDRVANTISIPLAAVFVDSEGPFVYRRGGGGFAVVRVSVGARSLREIEVKGGIEAGDDVALAIPELR